MIELSKNEWTTMVIGAIIAISFEKIIKFVLLFYQNVFTYKRRKEARKKMECINFDNINGYLALDNAIPYYEEKNIFLKYDEHSEQKNVWFVGRPDAAYYNELFSNDFKIRDDEDSLLDNEALQKSFSYLQIDNYQQELNEAKNSVAQQLIKELQNGGVRFNGLMFGVKKIRINRDSTNEKAQLFLEFYKTDFFTFRVMAKIFEKHKEKFSLSRQQSLNKIPHFTPSFGIGCFVFFKTHDEYFLLLVHRSKNTIVDHGKIHFSMNEAFTDKDRDEFGKPSLRACMIRGLHEELGIPNEIKEHFLKHYGFLDFGVQTDRLELGISCFTVVELNKELTIEKIKEYIEIAADKTLEIANINFVSLNKLEEYLKENEQRMSAGCYTTLKHLNVRIKLGQII